MAKKRKPKTISVPYKYATAGQKAHAKAPRKRKRTTRKKKRKPKKTGYYYLR